MSTEAPSAEERRARVIEALSDAGISASLAHELQYVDRYRIHRRTHAAVLDVHYDGRGRITGIEPGDVDGNAGLVLAAIGVIEQLPRPFLRPRLADRVSSPSVLRERHGAMLADVGIEIVGLRLASYQLMYDLEDAGSTTLGADTRLSLWYNRRGEVTSCECDDGELAARAVEALGIADGLVRARPRVDGGDGGA